MRPAKSNGIEWTFAPARLCLVAAALCGNVLAVRGADRIYSVRPDGTELRVEVDLDLVDDSMTYAVPQCSPDGSRLVFDVTPKGDKDFARSKLTLFHRSGVSKGTVLDLDYGKAASWSPDGNRIAFCIFPNNPKGFDPGVWILDVSREDSEAVRLSDGFWPCWNPDGKSLIARNFNATGHFLQKVTIDTKETEPFLSDYQHLKQIHWSPDGKRVLANIVDAGEKRLVTVPPDGARDSMIELATGDIENGRYSPDGKTICYSMKNDVGGNDLFLIASDGKTPAHKTAIAPQVRKGHCFWLKDGPRLGFCATSDLRISGQ